MKSLYNLLLSVCGSSANSELIQWLYHENCIVDNYKQYNRAYSLVWPASMQIYENKKKFYIRKESNSHRIWVEHQNGYRFIVLEHQYHGHCVVMWIRSIT